jgi:di/tricarboxylate transporter
MAATPITRLLKWTALAAFVHAVGHNTLFAACRDELEKLGPITRQEIIMAATLFLTVALWIFGNLLGINSVCAAIVGVGILLFTEVLTWKQCLNEGRGMAAGHAERIAPLPLAIVYAITFRCIFELAAFLPQWSPGTP